MELAMRGFRVLNQEAPFGSVLICAKGFELGLSKNRKYHINSTPYTTSTTLYRGAVLYLVLVVCSIQQRANEAVPWVLCFDREAITLLPSQLQ